MHIKPSRAYRAFTIFNHVFMVLVMFLLVLVAVALQKTRLGKATRAVSDNPDLASSTGIDSQRIIRIVWILGGMLAATGGIFRGLDEGVGPFMGADLLFCPFTAPTYAEPGIPTVCTIYDLQYKTYPEFFGELDLAVGPGVFVGGQGKGVVPMENPSDPRRARCPMLEGVAYCY